MTERWLVEMQKVERLEPIPDLLARAEVGPSLAEPSPPPGRRVVAGLVALVIAIAGGWLAFSALNASGGRQATGDGSSSVAGWPDASVAEAQKVQAKVDSGAPEAQWRTDAAAVALRYGQTVLGWPSPLAGVNATDDPDVVVVSLHGPDASCAAPCSGSVSPQSIAILTLQRLVRKGDGGVWSVTSVADQDAFPTQPAG